MAMAVAGCCPATYSASVEEPATVFYGRIIGTGSERPFLVTEGELRWNLRRADGGPMQLQATLWPLKEGEFSYRLDVPHEALVSGFIPRPESVPLTPVEETLTIIGIRVNGLPARLAGPTAETFDVDQARRAATHRMDLEVALTAEDSDGDGLPDWFEELYGGDLKPHEDPDGDGLDTRAEYLAGTNPLLDSRRPTLATAQIRAYIDCLTGVHLQVLDSDTAPGNLTFTLTSPPAGFELRLRNARTTPEDPDAVLSEGAVFTQADVLNGRLVLAPVGGEPPGDSSFGISLRDDAPDGEPVSASIGIRVYQPEAALLEQVSGPVPPQPSVGLSSLGFAGLSADEALRLRSYLLGTEQNGVLWDYSGEDSDLKLSAPSSGLSIDEYEGSYRKYYGPEHAQALLGGRGSDELRGGMADDLLCAGAGQNRLSGGGGRDRFLFANGGSTEDTVTDFDAASGDVLDFAVLLRGASKRLRDYLKVQPDGDGCRLLVDQDGDGSGFTDLTVRLPNLPASAADLHDLLDAGALAVGNLTLPPRITIAASQPVARENGPTPGEFLLSRTGDVEGPTTVHLDVRGSAVNGVDFASVPGTVVFSAGARTAKVTITPFLDSQAEPAETVEVTLVAGNDYEVAAAARAEVSIADLQPVVSVEALEPLATTDPVAPGTLLVKRDAVVDRSLLVRLDFKGTAVGGVDFQSVSKFVNLTAGQTTALIPIQPNGGTLTGRQAKSVVVSVLPDASYLVGTEPRAEVLLVRRPVSVAGWRAENFPGFAGSAAEFLADDPGRKGVSNAMRYAFGMDPENPEQARLPKVSVRDGHLTVEVWRRPGATDVDVQAVASNDLGDWAGGTQPVERFHPSGQPENPEVLSFLSLTPVGEAPVQFFNIRIVFHP